MNKILQKQKIINSLKQNTTFNKLISTLQKIKQKPCKKFTGIGILVYNKKFLEDKRFMPLRPNSSPPDNLLLGKKDTINFLREISQNNHKFHDGYIFFNNKGLLTHIAQYLEIRLDNTVQPHKLHGTRYLSSLIASKMKGVEMVGNISNNLSGHIFICGKAFSLGNILKLQANTKFSASMPEAAKEADLPAIRLSSSKSGRHGEPMAHNI